jgi:adenosylhomocysteine nucleosidase
MLGLITATIQEQQALEAILQEQEQIPGPAGLSFIRGRLGAHTVVAVKAGIGKVNAALCAQALIDRMAPDSIINVGVAGALDPTLHIADVVISEGAVQHDFDTTFFGDKAGFLPEVNRVVIPADEKLIRSVEQACAAEAIPCRRGRILSGDQFIAGDAKKDELRTRFAGTCTEMEGAAIAQVCWLNQVPFVILRAISDGAGEGANMQYDEFVQVAARQAMRILEHLPSEG